MQPSIAMTYSGAPHYTWASVLYQKSGVLYQQLICPLRLQYGKEWKGRQSLHMSNPFTRLHIHSHYITSVIYAPLYGLLYVEHIPYAPPTFSVRMPPPFLL